MEKFLVLEASGALWKFGVRGGLGDMGTLRIMHWATGGRTVDFVQLGSADMWFDPDGTDRPVNTPATMLAQRLGQVRQPYFGAAMFSARRGLEIAGLSDEQIAYLESTVSEIRSCLLGC